MVDGTAVLALGSNVGDRLGHLRAAVTRLGAVAVSPVYETDPVGGPEQDGYLPGHGRIADLLAGLDTSGVRPTSLVAAP